MRRCQRVTLESVEQPQLLLEQERAVERLVGPLHFGQQLELLGLLLGGRLQQRPARALDPAPLGRVRALVRVPLIAADAVDAGLGSRTTWKGSKATSACGMHSRIAFS